MKVGRVTGVTFSLQTGSLSCFFYYKYIFFQGSAMFLRIPEDWKNESDSSQSDAGFDDIGCAEPYCQNQTDLCQSHLASHLPVPCPMRKVQYLLIN